MDQRLSAQDPSLGSGWWIWGGTGASSGRHSRWGPRVAPEPPAGDKPDISHIWTCGRLPERRCPSDYLLQTTGAAATAAHERTADGENLLAEVVLDVQHEGSHGATAGPVTAAVLLRCVEHVLSQAILDLILVVGLPAKYNWKSDQRTLEEPPWEAD